MTDPLQCGGAGFQQNVAANPNASAPFIPILGCIDLTRPTPSANDGCTAPQSVLFGFHGSGDVREIALYLQDTITKGSWSFNVGVRGDLYRGLTKESQIEPRAGISYNIKPSNTVLRVSYARILETPFNENLVVASVTANPFLDAIFGGSSGAIRAGQRNEFHAGFQQAFGRYLVVEGEYMWKYTHNAYDFSVLGNTPISFPIGWHNSKIPGFMLGSACPISMASPPYFMAQLPRGSFNRKSTGIAHAAMELIFRIDHDELSTNHARAIPTVETRTMGGFNWRFDSGLVAGPVPFADRHQSTPVDLRV